MIKLITFCPANQIICETSERSMDYSYFGPDSTFAKQSPVTKGAKIGHREGLCKL